MKDSNTRFSFRDFGQLPDRQKKAVYMLAGCAVVFLLVVVLSSILIFGNGPAASAESGSYDKDAQSIDLSQYEETVLPETEDAGQTYLDETLFIGDSNTVRLYMYGLVPLENYMGLEGMGIEEVPASRVVYFEGYDSPVTIPEAVKLVQPRRIVMMFGTNNANGTISVDSFISTYKKSIEALQDAYPYSDILIASIPPRCRITEYTDVSMGTVDAFNKALVQMAEDLGLKYLNITEALKDDSGYGKSELFDADGLHFSLSGAQTLLEYVRTHAYETADSRPAVTNVPNRVAPPSTTISSSSEESSSVASSSESDSSSSSESVSSAAPSSATSSEQAPSSQTSSSATSSEAAPPETSSSTAPSGDTGSSEPSAPDPAPDQSVDTGTADGVTDGATDPEPTNEQANLA